MSDVGVFTVVGVMLAFLVALLTLHWRVVTANMREMRLQLNQLADLVDVPSDPMAPRKTGNEPLVEIVAPRDHKPNKPNRLKDKHYEVPKISGIARGEVGAAYLVVRATPNGQPRLSTKLVIQNGFWEASAVIPPWEKSSTHEVFAFATREETNFVLGSGRFFMLPEFHKSKNVVEVRIEYVDE